MVEKLLIPQIIISPAKKPRPTIINHSMHVGASVALKSLRVPRRGLVANLSVSISTVSPAL